METESTLHEEPQRNEWLGITIRTLLALAVLGAAYFGIAQYFGNRIPNGTTVHGVDIGNITPEDARETVTAKLEDLATDPVVVEIDGEQISLDPATAGLGLDVDATLEGIAGVSYDPRVLWSRVTDSGRELELVDTVDRAQLEDAVAEHADAFGQEAKEGSVALKLGTVDVKEPVEGRSLDVAGTADAVEAGWPDTREVEGSWEPVLPALSAEEIDRFVSEEAEPALDSSIVIKVGSKYDAAITPNQLSRLLTVEESEDHTLSLVLDEEGTVEVARGALGKAEKTPQNASVRLGSNGKPQLIKADKGRVLDSEELLTKVNRALFEDGSRWIRVGTTPVDPKITDEDAAKWTIDEKMGEFRSQFPTTPGNEDRTENIRVGLGHVNGTVVMPGDQFSLGDALSPITEDAGYVKAGVISDGRLVEGLGGGLSQVSTTVLNTAWESGVQLDEFTPHSYYISRYPEGREATISVPVIDNKWTNDTDSPIIVQTRIEGDEIVMRFWGDRQYTVQTHTSGRSNVVQPGRKTDDSPNCLYQSPQVGFDVTVTRVLLRGGDEVDRRSYTTHYNASDEVVCTGG
ncbi:VanW family protein [Ornithinicoccus hortensis]|uniref:VanW like protein n=1 Tax=Ornithinicoccus hortensis TaxID=82346 RepID=A0A542YPU8_9MICO|nr:VanW family protein [Ornithinicoccus hortensis]TQL50132.1 VanW like protein [Ornithinicoccus hortensis]